MQFTLEKWQNGYLNDFIAATEDPHLADKMCEALPYPMDTAYAVEYIKDRMLNSEERQICRAVTVDGRLVGGVDVVFGNGIYEKNGELSLWIAKDYRGKGLGAAVISEMSRICFALYDIRRIEAHPYSDHKEAITAIVNAGFQHEGTMHSAIYKNGVSYDYEVFALLG